MKLKLPHIAYELTDKCNLACKYCYNIWKNPHATNHKSFNSYSKAVKTLEEIFSQAEIDSITLTGGEPFMAERLLEMALFCRLEDKQVTMISNGSLGKRSDYKSLIGMGVHLFEMPIHSFNEATHDSITQVKGSWKRSILSLMEIKALGGYPVAVIVLTKYNVDRINETLDFIHSLGIKRIMINRYNIGGSGADSPASVSATHTQLREAYKIADKKAEELELTISSNVCTPICLLHPEEFPHILFGHCPHDVLRKPITLDINGNVRLCNHSPAVAGNIYKQPIATILYSDYAESWKKIIPGYCSKCTLWEKCRGGCRAASEQCGFDLGHVDPILTLT